MRTIFCFIVCKLAALYSFPQQVVSIIPQPQQVDIREGNFPLHKARLILPADPKAKSVARFFADAVKQQTAIVLSTVKVSSYSISFVYKKSIADPEGYEISIQPKNILVQANNDKGLFWAVQTLRQLLPLKKQLLLNCPACR